jgi:uncharacterized tellurite resistance protein B-like protein
VCFDRYGRAGAGRQHPNMQEPDGLAGLSRRGGAGMALTRLRIALERWRARKALSRRLDGDPVAVAKILLLFRMMLADGFIRDRELAAFHDICRQRFGISEREIPVLQGYLERRHVRSATGSREQILKTMTRQERQELIALMGQLAAVAQQDPQVGELVPAPDHGVSHQFIRDTAHALGLSGVPPQAT